jgi:hypothetical protein
MPYGAFQCAVAHFERIIMFTFSIVYRNLSGAKVQGLYRVSGPDRNAAIAATKAAVAIEGWELLFISTI